MKLTIGKSRLDTLRSFRPGFMERDMIVPSWGVWDSERHDERRLRYRRSMFPVKDDAGYIGYLSDSGGINEVANDLIALRRREILGSDITFTNTLIVVLIGVVLLFFLAASPWGIPPPPPPPTP